MILESHFLFDELLFVIVYVSWMNNVSVCVWARARLRNIWIPERVICLKFMQLKNRLTILSNVIHNLCTYYGHLCFFKYVTAS
jgi:hypothetical protein